MFDQVIPLIAVVSVFPVPAALSIQHHADVITEVFCGDVGRSPFSAIRNLFSRSSNSGLRRVPLSSENTEMS